MQWLKCVIIPPDTEYMGAILDSRLTVGPSVRPSVGRSVRLWTNFVRTITQQPLEGIQLNFTEVITGMPSCACSKELLFGLIFKELWPFVFLNSVYMQNLSGLLLSNY